MTPEEKKKYYQYVPGKTLYWWLKDAPARDPEFERELTGFGGLNPFGKPNLKVTFGQKIMSDRARLPRLKYCKHWRGLTHFEYADLSGNIQKVQRPDEVPAYAQARPIYQTLELGELRWMVEYWQPIEQAIAAGAFDPKINGSDGKPLYCAPPQEGVYNLFYKVKAADNRSYADLSRDVMDYIKGEWHFNQNATLADKWDALVAAEREDQRIGREQSQNVWSKDDFKDYTEQANDEKEAERKAYEQFQKEQTTLIYT